MNPDVKKGPPAVNPFSPRNSMSKLSRGIETNTSWVYRSIVPLTRFNKILFKFNVGNFLRDRPKITFSIAGEDMFLSHLIRNLSKEKKISWLDIGAANPIVGNHFFLLYRFLKSSPKRRGITVSVDPRPGLNWRYRLTRPKEIFISAVIQESESSFYLNRLDPNNSSKHRLWAEGITGSTDEYKKYIQEIVPKSLSIKDLQMRYPNLFESSDNDTFSILSIDVEGNQLEVLNTVDWQLSQPDLILIEIFEPVWGKGPRAPTLSSAREDSTVKVLLDLGYQWVGGNTMTQFFVRDRIMA